MRNDFESHYLAHHGILGQKWGHRNGPPYPLGASDHSPSEKKAGWRASLKQKQIDKKRKKQRQEALEKARKARAEKARQERLETEYNAKKTQVLRSGKASEVMRYKGQMDNKELSDALNRIRWESELSKIAAAEQKSNFDKIDEMMDKVGTMKNWANTAMDVYDIMIQVHNFRNPDDEKRFIKKGNKDKKKDKDDD